MFHSGGPRQAGEMGKQESPEGQQRCSGLGWDRVSFLCGS